ncbi:MAG: 4-hydroxy-tetrahydrodipicolinate synthase [bacterium]
MEWGRLLTATVTPFDKEGNIDFSQVSKLANYLLDNGSEGIVVSGTTGESPTLSSDEKLKLFAAVKETVGGRGAVLAATGGNSTQQSVELTKKTAGLGLDGIMLVSPYYNKPSQEGLYQHFATIAESTDLPILIYNIPGRTGINIELSTLLRLSKVANIKAVKEASGNMSQIADTIAQVPEGFKVYSGDDLLALPVLCMGGYGLISVTAHIVGNDLSRMFKAYLSGDVALAASLHNKMVPIVKAMFSVTNPTPVKYALNRMGHEVGGTRLPLVELNDKECEDVDAALVNYGLIH